MKKLVCAILVLSLALVALAGCGGGSGSGGNAPGGSNAPAPSADGGDSAPAGEVSYTWSVGMNSVEGDIPYYMAVRFKQLVEEKSAGAIQVNLYPGGQMGGDAELTENVMAGSLEFYCGTTSPTVPYVTAAAVLDCHWEFDSMEHFRRMMDGGFFDLLNEKYQESNMRIVSFAEVGERKMMSNKKIESVQDLAGQKIRVMQNKYHIAAWSALGASPTPMDWGEVYVALQQKIIDAVEQPYFFICSSKLYEVQDYMLETNHFVQPATLFMSESVYQSLPADIQQLVDECGEEAKQYTRGVCDDLTAEKYQEIVDNNVEVLQVSPEMLTEMRTLVAPANELVKEDVGEEFFEQYASFRDAAR